MSLMDDYFKGFAVADSWYHNSRNQAQSRRRNQILIDAAQMELDESRALQPNRLANAAITFDNDTHHKAQQLRFRKALEPLAWQNEQSKLAAGTAQNDSAIIANRQAQAITQATFGHDMAAAQNNAAANAANATTGRLQAGALLGATQDNVGNIRQTYNTGFQTAATAGEAATHAATGQLQHWQHLQHVRSLNAEALDRVGTDPTKQVQYLTQVGNDPTRPIEQRQAAAYVVQSVTAGDGKVDPRLLQVETNPVSVLAASGVDFVFLQMDKNGFADVVIDGVRRTIPWERVQEMAAIQLGIDPSRYTKAADTLQKAHVDFTTGNVVHQLTNTGPEPLRPEAVNTLTNRSLHQLGHYRNAEGIWMNGATDQPLSQEEFSEIQQAIKTRYQVP